MVLRSEFGVSFIKGFFVGLFLVRHLIFEFLRDDLFNLELQGIFLELST